MKTLNNKGMTLVEMIIGTALLAIAGIMLVSSFTASTRIINRATIFKNVSSAAASSIELEEVQACKDERYAIELNDYNASSQAKKITVKCEKFNASGNKIEDINFDIDGSYIIASESDDTNLKYREYLPTNFTFVVDADPVSE